MAKINTVPMVQAIAATVIALVQESVVRTRFDTVARTVPASQSRRKRRQYGRLGWFFMLLSYLLLTFLALRG